MLNFYKKVAIALVGMLVFSALTGLLCARYTFRHAPLLPHNRSFTPWSVEAVSDELQGGNSHIAIQETHFSLVFDFLLKQGAKFPYTAFALVFAPTGELDRYLNLSPYSHLTFSVQCSRENVLTFALFTVDPQVSDPNDISTYRLPTTFFSCYEQWTTVSIDLTRLETPQWWFSLNSLELSQQGYDLTQVPRFTIGNSFQSPFDVNSEVRIAELTLHGRNWGYLYTYIGLLALCWILFGVWVARLHTKTLIQSLKEKMQKDRPLIAYKQLSLEPQKDREKENILRYMATQYANPELNLDVAISSLAVSRTKINDVLKAELGYTFSAYLNKLRLTEAARLLAEKKHISVAEIAYSVGYRNVPYFNKLFKSEYGCTPKVFKQSYSDDG
ncbi:helix-turn-helix domain-containing protein [Teredinibacter turnerae]|uniref:helix-turn-helix domain-containing protein n=1 Tax=Teredinibacter turnerae TaxID=2426 RepID=UPI000379B5A8|nr:helix-turn-helix domain-containing protein [Teredinibacter turnerae]